MTAAEMISHIEDSIAKALRGESFLDPSVLDIKGFATATQRHLVSNLAHLPKADPCYLEVGLYAGATFCAAMSNNPDLNAFGIEDWSQDFGDKTIKAQFGKALQQHASVQQHLDMLKGRAICVIEEDCFAMNNAIFKEAVDLYYYDGSHDQSAQAKALPHFIDQMADVFIFLIDDYAWEPVREGTIDGFNALKGRVFIEHAWVLRDRKSVV